MSWLAICLIGLLVVGLICLVILLASTTLSGRMSELEEKRDNEERRKWYNLMRPTRKNGS